MVTGIRVWKITNQKSRDFVRQRIACGSESSFALSAHAVIDGDGEIRCVLGRTYSRDFLKGGGYVPAGLFAVAGWNGATHEAMLYGLAPNESLSLMTEDGFAWRVTRFLGDGRGRLFARLTPCGYTGLLN